MTVRIRLVTMLMSLAGAETVAAAPWFTETVDDVGVVGDWCSIAVDSANRVHISYEDARRAHSGTPPEAVVPGRRRLSMAMA